MGVKKGAPINLFRPRIISSWCQTTQQALALPEKEVIQPHLPVRLPCYDFTPVTSPAFGIPLLAVKVTTSGMASSHSVTGGVYKARERIHRRMADRRLLAIPASCRRHVCRPGHKGHDDLTSSSPSSGLSPAVCSGHAPPVSAFPKAPLSFKRIRGMSSPGGILNALATALHGSIRTAPSIHRLRLGLLGYLIPFAPLAFVSQCQCRPSRVLSPLVFFPISTHFTAPPEIPSAPTVLQLDALRPIIPDNACILCLTAAAGTELADAYSPDTVIASSPGKEESGPCLSPSVADHPLGPATDHRLGKLLPHQLANQTRAPPRADSSFCSSAYGVLAAVSSCCSPPKGRFLRVTHPSATGNTTSRPTCMCKACRQRSS
ncbi:hypothetical protein DEO72_LG6g1223 [Vigna unguiculata]|nr:hypothetical protein DEO72_LG6g1223 [Vigna unguiculata]